MELKYVAVQPPSHGPISKLSLWNSKECFSGGFKLEDGESNKYLYLSSEHRVQKSNARFYIYKSFIGFVPQISRNV